MHKAFRRVFCALFSAILLFTCVGSASAGASSSGEHMTAAAVPVYYAGLYGEESSELTVYFRDGNTQIPYYDMDTVASVMTKLYRDGYGDYSKDPDYTLTYTVEGDVVTFSRENGYDMVLDFDENYIYFIDYDLFVSHSFDETVLEFSHSTGFDDDGNPVYLQRCADDSFSRYGDEILIGLDNYSIELIEEDGNFYIPAQTVADLLLGETYTVFLYNGSACFYMNYDNFLADLDDPDSGFTALYYADGPQERSPELIEFTYNELVLKLDLCYGFRESRSILSFYDYLEEIEYKDGVNLKRLLMSDDPVDMDIALCVLVRQAFDDLHSAYLAVSPYTGTEKESEVRQISSGSSMQQFSEVYSVYLDARCEYFPNGVPGYQEIGNTAYVTFDTFTAPRNTDYYASAPTDDSSDDNFGLLIYANSQIRRENSPIENVVIDLSCNTGGMEDAAAFVTAWFLGETSEYFYSSLTGATAVNSYRCDVNLDHKFDDADTVSDLNLFCLISPVSFSCGNLTPCIFKTSGQVILVGRTSGGGSCIVHPFTTASGSVAQCSGYKHISSMKNGSFYDSDQGIEPDIVLIRPESLYDREALTDYLNSLK